MNAQDIREALACGRQGCACRRGRNTHCPAHDDRVPSLTVDDRNGTVVWNCKTGCTQENVLAELRARGLLERDGATPLVLNRTERLVKEYEFSDAEGTPIAYHGRFEGPGGKTFKWRRADGVWAEGLGFPEHELPLYGLGQLSTRQADPVWFVEGEKAADACTDRGLLAVSLGGGASQQRFGNALDPLQGREVIFWPDNDDAGRALMSRLAGYFQNARSVAPPLAKGGDAYDYFASGGTVEALWEMAKALEPRARVIDYDTIEVTYPLTAGALVFAFTEFWAAARELSASFRLAVEYPGLSGIDYTGRVNFRSPSNRNTLRLEIEKVYETKQIPWAKVIAAACSLAEAAWLGIDTSVDITDVAPSRTRKWLVDHWAPLNVVTCVFGMGNSGKSLLMLDLALHCLFDDQWMGQPIRNVKGFTVLDYEDHEDEWRMRVDQLCAAHGWTMERGMFRYEPGRGIPVVDHVRLREKLIERGHELLIVDSAISAVGGKVLDEVAVATCLNRLNDFGRDGITTMLIAHVTKAEGSEYPFGSIFWHNLVRGTHYVEHNQADGSRLLDLILWNRKANRGKQRAISVRVEFNAVEADGPIQIGPSTSAAQAVRAENDEGQQRIAVLRAMQELKRAALVKEIASLSGLDPEVVRVVLNRMVKRDEYVVEVGKDGNSKLWGLRDDREEQSPKHVTKQSETRFVTKAETTPPLRGVSDVSRETDQGGEITSPFAQSEEELTF